MSWGAESLFSKTKGGAVNILITGGTGFLGKHVVRECLSHPGVKKIFICSRRIKSHPDPRIKMFNVDLTDPLLADKLPLNVDVVIHLAGLYNFFNSKSENYLSNTVATFNLLGYISTLSQPVEFIHSSTYALITGNNAQGLEQKIEGVLAKESSYVYTKALAEQIVLAGKNYKKIILRLGVLVGDTKKGDIEKIDGPYYVLKALEFWAKYAPKSLHKTLPLPIDPRLYFPLVPVDSAAKVVVSCLGNSKIPDEAILGVVNSQSISVGAMLSSIFANLKINPQLKATASPPPWFLKFLHTIELMPEDLFSYLVPKKQLENPSFCRYFPKAIPTFPRYEKNFYSGYNNFRGDLS